MAIDRATRRVFTAPIGADDEASNRRITARVLSLPVAIERELEGQFYLGAGVDGERRLLKALNEILRKEESQ